ncbi:MAG: O-antigen ligase family protein [Bacteroidia bacterium]|nr:O-antigen ligase family protein [Bacteroidia bacterium]
MYLITGLNSHKNLLTSFLFLMLPFVIIGLKKFRSYWKFLSVLALLCSTILIVLLRTKAVWLGLSAGTMFFIITFFLKKKNIGTGSKPFFVSVFMLVLINLLFIFLLPSLIKKYSTGVTENNSIAQKPLMAGLDQERLMVWDKTYTIMTKQPLFGYGTGNWQIYFPDATLTGLWRVEDLNVTFQRPHNDFLWLLSETGFIGFNLFMGFLILLVVSGLYYLKSLQTSALIYLSGIIGFYIVSFFDFPRERTEHLVWIHCLLALLYFQIKSTGGVSSVFSIGVRKRFFLLPVSLLAFILFVGLLRFKGEYFTRLLYDYKNSGRLSDVVKSGHSALSFAYTLDPTSVPVQWYTGNAQAALGHYDAAQSDFISAHNFNPYNRNVLNDLASAYVFNQQTQLAIPLYEEAARISPRFDEPKLNLTAIYIGKGDFASANQWLKSLLHNSERRTNYENLVNVELQNQKFNSLTK